MTNRNSHIMYYVYLYMGQVPELKLMMMICAFDWYQNHRLWMVLNCCEFSEFCASWHVWEATTAKLMKIDQHCQWGCCCTLKVLFNDVACRPIDFVDSACWAILTGGRFSELRLIYHGCRALTFALARLSCSPFDQLARLIQGAPLQHTMSYNVKPA